MHAVALLGMVLIPLPSWLPGGTAIWWCTNPMARRCWFDADWQTTWLYKCPWQCEDGNKPERLALPEVVLLLTHCGIDWRICLLRLLLNGLGKGPCASWFGYCEFWTITRSSSCKVRGVVGPTQHPMLSKPMRIVRHNLPQMLPHDMSSATLILAHPVVCSGRSW